MMLTATAKTFHSYILTPFNIKNIMIRLKY